MTVIFQYSYIFQYKVVSQIYTNLYANIFSFIKLCSEHIFINDFIGISHVIMRKLNGSLMGIDLRLTAHHKTT